MPPATSYFLFALIYTLRLARSDTFTLGYLTGAHRRPGDLEYPRPGLQISGAISLAVDEVNSGELGREGHRLRFLVAETYGTERTSIRRTAELWRRNVSVYIGPQETCVHEAKMAAAFNLPMISYFCTDEAASDKSEFPTFARTRPPDTQISKSVTAVLLAFNWRHVVFLYLASPDFEHAAVARSVLAAITDAGITVRHVRTWEAPYHHGYMDNPFTELVEQTYRDTRIYVVLGHYYEQLGMMFALEQRGLLTDGDYWVVGVDIEQYESENPGKYLRGLLRDEPDPEASLAFRRYLSVVASAPTTSTFDNFTHAVNAYMERPPFNFPNPLTAVGGVKRLRAEAAYLYDAVHLYSRALLAEIHSGGDPYNGTSLVSRLMGIAYLSAMGYEVRVDEHGDAEGNYTLLASDEVGLVPVGVFAPGDEKTELPKLLLTGRISWVDDRPPPAEPPCGFRNERCNGRTAEIGGGIAGGAALALALVALALYRNWRYEQELDSLLWRIVYRDIQMKESGRSINRASGQPMRTSQVSLSSNPDADFRYTTLFTQVGVYRGRLVAIKRINKKSIDLTREMKKELKMMRELRHDNLNGWVGACIEAPQICIVSEYCARGSLRDVLDNADIATSMDGMFVASLVGDILRGLTYLHDSPVRVHGRLHPGNCLVDSRWVLRLADYGLREFKRGAEEQDSCRKLLYRAPELLRREDGASGSQKGDVYAFAVLLYELEGRRGPWGDTELAPQEIVRRVRAGQGLRPPIDEHTPEFVRDCLRECWREVPEERPDLRTVRTKLRPLRKGMKPNIFDNMMAMMEKYANNLEVLVDERTDQLLEEKKKTEALLFEMLPKPVAEQLKRGCKVEAESFDCVTIYFSDIVGFTAMSAESTPLQVVDFLNELYTVFDSIIEGYDVYKVETIGDAYMVVSGLPIRNGDEHAAEVASMSLELLSAVHRFTIRHRPGDTLRLRIGIHTGPVCAGVVGQKMPRYCLFGDTVNTASRMESTGEALRVHCSTECRALLQRLGGYTLVERGLVPIKGKGERTTYWLVGEEPGWRLSRRRARAPRSSLKVRRILDSPKRLRFASGSVLEVIADGSPCRSRGMLLAPRSGTNSNSCPCIENLAQTSVRLAQSPIQCATYLSVPALSAQPERTIGTKSAPVSPATKHAEESHWQDNTPLLSGRC